MIKKLLDKTFIKFIAVGIVNTLIGTAVMFSFYNCFHFNYWISSAANYIVGSVVSYVLNKHFTFCNNERSWKILIKFIIYIVFCYIIAYGIAKPSVFWLLSAASISAQENSAMLIGMILFVGLNYVGQRCFAFKKNNEEYEPEKIK